MGWGFGFGNKREKTYSDFWLDTRWRQPRTYSIWDKTDSLATTKKRDLIQLTSYRRAIANFVEILTGKNIPVKFISPGTLSHASEKAVTISADLEGGKFDVAVGLALHEGAHIQLSSFSILKNLKKHIPQKIFDLALTKGYNEKGVLVQVQSMLNYVEDRRIDYYIFSTSPGYKGYYHKMYDECWNNDTLSWYKSLGDG